MFIPLPALKCDILYQLSQLQFTLLFITRLQIMQFDCSEMTLCGWQDIKIQLLIYLYHCQHPNVMFCTKLIAIHSPLYW